MTGQQNESLTAKLRTQVREQLAEADALTRGELQQHAQRLTKQCSDVLTQTESVISGQRQSLAEVQSEFQTTRQALQRALSEARNTAERSLLSHLEQQTLKQALTDQLKTVHSEAIGGQLTPLRRELTALNREAQNLSRTTAKAWLKPLAIGGCAGLGVVLAVLIGTLTLDQVIGSRAATLSDLNSKISDQRMTLTRLQGSTWGIDLRVIEGQQYIVLPAGRMTDGRSWQVGDRQAIKVE